MKYRKKPVEIEAVMFNGSTTDIGAIKDWMNGGECPNEARISTCDIRNLEIETLEGTMTAKPGDYIIKGVNGEFYPCKPDIFKATYDRVE